MLRQLARLTRPVPAAGPRALAIAVYSDATGSSFEARERGLEGVACVDDAARAVVLLARLAARTGNPALRSWTEGLLGFVLWMGAGDGLWHNFIVDWEGTVNRRGPTSSPGLNFWQARATEAALVGGALLGDVEATRRGADGLAAASQPCLPSDVRAVHCAAALTLLRGGGDSEVRAHLGRWTEEITACRHGEALMNSPDERGAPHLWGHTQEAVLAEAASLLDRPALLGVAERSARAVFAGPIASGFDLPSVQPYGVQSAVTVMDALGAASGRTEYSVAARQARAWFGGRNPAHRAVYDRATGRVADGIDGGVLNEHSGAESNLAAGLALAGDPFVVAQAASWSGLLVD